ncbi:hypothetical protein BU26DRAFT_556678 [Trematosphaeria pertusa]|uniref:Uncharacterized protein n=1 Tax=Trematosphaeria pertusa TaxID=390896 RepID=A0A6A6HRX9_9PLEO|nr:uncharacterized protein BU26DRAFT_556678 [Trematosphaeria pertusa]KAF2240582.1 hypothetical protein BU26DRAFT_556678 [Trematosphaeria pertusa]
MKLLAHTLLPLALANPMTTPNPVAHSLQHLEARDKYCWFHPNVNGPQGCDSDQFNGNRVRTVYYTDNFGVRCSSTGKNVNGNTKWYYVPGWSCWISDYWTNASCDGEVPGVE